MISTERNRKRINWSSIFDASQDELYHFSMKRSNLQWSRPEFQSICSKGVLAVCCYMTRLLITNDVYKQGLRMISIRSVQVAYRNAYFRWKWIHLYWTGINFGQDLLTNNKWVEPYMKPRLNRTLVFLCVDPGNNTICNKGGKHINI